MKECPGCALEVEEQFERCPICGYEFPVIKRHRKWMAILLLIVFSYPLLQAVKRLVQILASP
ncbi:MAG: zinc ribbon domain-containing protein [candidate division KSB1 bacterium]|nr:zinc ribbon domain-containing protein [candidate division KSB1 bacterium]MDZ7345705.1 zinc ribbon domain-containing protein [candidate division KSB1 bacterium]